MFVPLAEAGPEDEIVFLDIVSHYANVAMSHSFPVGPYEIIIGQDVKKILFDDNKGKFFYGKEEIFGLIQAKVIPPTDLLIPYLPYKPKTGKNGVEHPLVYPLCGLCARNRAQKFCGHKSAK